MPLAGDFAFARYCFAARRVALFTWRMRTEEKLTPEHAKARDNCGE